MINGRNRAAIIKLFTQKVWCLMRPMSDYCLGKLHCAYQIPTHHSRSHEVGCWGLNQDWEGHHPSQGLLTWLAMQTVWALIAIRGQATQCISSYGWVTLHITLLGHIYVTGKKKKKLASISIYCV